MMTGDEKKFLDSTRRRLRNVVGGEWLGRNPMSKNSSLTSFSMEDCYWLYERGCRAGRWMGSEVWDLIKVWDLAFFHVRDEIGFSWEEYARTNQASGKQGKRN